MTDEQMLALAAVVWMAPHATRRDSMIYAATTLLVMFGMVIFKSL